MTKKTYQSRAVRSAGKKKVAKKKSNGAAVRSVKAPFKASSRVGLKKAVASSQAGLPAWFWSL